MLDKLRILPNVSSVITRQIQIGRERERKEAARAHLMCLGSKVTIMTRKDDACYPI